MTGATSPRLTGRDLRVLGEARVRQGFARMRAAWFPILQAAVAGGVAYAIAHYWVGHPIPFFAPVCAWIALGFSMDRSVRKVAELAVGVAIGVGLGDLVAHVIGHGIWQISLVLFASAMLARFIDRGVLLTTQAGVQAIVIVALPATSGGPFGRWVDAADRRRDGARRRAADPERPAPAPARARAARARGARPACCTCSRAGSSSAT